MIVRTAYITAIALMLWMLSGCATRFSDSGAPRAPANMTTGAAPSAGGATGSSGSTGGSAPATKASGPAPRILPTLRSEPLLRVLLVQNTQVSFTLLTSATLPNGNRLAAGTHLAQAVGATLVIDGAAVPAECPLVMALATRRFSTLMDPPVGRAQTLEFSGQPVVRLAGNKVQLLEEILLETYLAGVLPTEMNPSWPVQALAAQAIAARSYAAAKYLERFDKPWQLHWHYTVDMAYGGASVKSTAALREALKQTRGQMLTYRGLPVPALFNACSGGTTEAATNVFSTLRGGDRSTPMASQMPSVLDADAEAGCQGLGMMKTHWRWKANIPLSDITQDLQAWARQNPQDSLEFGTVTNIEPLGRFGDSGRVAQVSVSSKIAGRTKRTVMPAQDFRMAISPLDIRSTWWDRCLVVAGSTSSKGMVLVLAGRGFGHGVGLSQVSAWQMATKGLEATSIVKHFYPQAVLERRW